MSQRITVTETKMVAVEMKVHETVCDRCGAVKGDTYDTGHGWAEGRACRDPACDGTECLLAGDNFDLCGVCFRRALSAKP